MRQIHGRVLLWLVLVALATGVCSAQVITERVLVPYFTPDQYSGLPVLIEGLAAFDAESGRRLVDLLPANGTHYGLQEQSWDVVPGGDVVSIQGGQLRYFEGLSGRETSIDYIVSPFEEPPVGILARRLPGGSMYTSEYLLRFPASIAAYQPSSGAVGQIIDLEASAQLLIGAVRWALGDGFLYVVLQSCESCDFAIRRFFVDSGVLDPAFEVTIEPPAGGMLLIDSFAVDAESGDLLLAYEEVDGATQTGVLRRLGSEGELLGDGFSPDGPPHDSIVAVGPDGFVYLTSPPQGGNDGFATSVHTFEGTQIRELEAVAERGLDIVSAPLKWTNIASPDRMVPLQLGRFLVEVSWRAPDDSTGIGHGHPLSSDSTALFWFFTFDNWELMVKVLDGCNSNDHYWVFTAASTDVEYTITVTDQMSNEVWTATNPLGVASPAITDTEAFATCPIPLP